MDTPSNLQNDYHAFFNKLESGRFFIDFLNGAIEDNHSKAEREPERARDYAQRAKGQREVLDHIKTVIGGSSKK